MRIAIAGCQWISAYLLDAFVAAGRAPVLTIAPDRALAGHLSGYRDLESAIRGHGGELYRPRSLNLKHRDDAAAFAAQAIDALVVFGWPRLIPQPILSACRVGAIGVHGGPAPPPRCRGRAVLNWTLILGCETFHVYAFRLTAGVDDGHILARAQFNIDPRDDIATLYNKHCAVSTRLLLQSVEDASRAGALTGTPQDSDGATYFPKREPEHGGIDWNAAASCIANLVRGVTDPYPGAFADGPQGRATILEAQAFDDAIAPEGAPGEIVDLFPNGDFVVAAGRGALCVRRWRSNGDFRPMRGYRFQPKSGIQPPDPVW